MRTRTMLYLDAEQHRALRGEAAREGVSMAALVRRIVSWYLDERKGTSKVSRGTYMKIVGLASSGRVDISERHDAYLARAVRRERSR